MTQTGNYRKGNFEIHLIVREGVFSTELHGDLSYWDELGVIEAYRALLRMKVLHEYKWPNVEPSPTPEPDREQEATTTNRVG